MIYTVHVKILASNLLNLASDNTELRIWSFSCCEAMLVPDKQGRIYLQYTVEILEL